jgi:hypothetical protein
MFVNLRHNTELRSISLDAFAGMVEDEYVGGGHLPLILSHISSTHLQEVKLTVGMEWLGWPDLKYHMWALDKLLEQPPFSPSLWLRMEIDINDESQRLIEDNIRSQLRGCNSRGRLIFSD